MHDALFDFKTLVNHIITLPREPVDRYHAQS